MPELAAQGQVNGQRFYETRGIVRVLRQHSDGFCIGQSFVRSTACSKQS